MGVCSHSDAYGCVNKYSGGTLLTTSHIAALLGALFFIFTGYSFAFRTEKFVKEAKEANDKSILSGTFVGDWAKSTIESEVYGISFRIGGYVGMAAGVTLLILLVTGYLDR